ncbi:MAG TPA: UPF0158 family protein [Brumimicrobium sp.]|nr:UPF0158 family protein [Brumimicrobium sp.]
MNLINNIAQELDCGMDCYYNPKTKELISLFGADLLATGDEDYYEEMFKEQINRVKAHKKDFIKIEVLESLESFKIMEKFKDEVPDLQLKEQLGNALADRKPFQNFKRLVDNSNYREDWFKFKVNEIENRVRKILEVNGVDVIH